MPSAPGAFTILGGGGAEAAPAATWKAVGACSMAMTPGPDGSGTDGETAATGLTTARTDGIGLFPWNGGAEPPTAPANTNEVIAATPNAGVRETPAPRFRAAAAAGRAPERPPMRTRPSSVCQPQRSRCQTQLHQLRPARAPYPAWLGSVARAFEIANMFRNNGMLLKLR